MTKSAEVLRILERYLVEVVEAYELCPWARPARETGELAVGIVWGAPVLDDWVGEAERLLARGASVAIVVAPEFAGPPLELRAVRDRVAARIPSAGVADFHPVAALDLASPARLVPFLRRSPDPMLQLVPLVALDRVRAGPAIADRAQQAAILGGQASPPPIDIAERIAAANHATVTSAHAAIVATLESIAADRRESYRRAGISVSR